MTPTIAISKPEFGKEEEDAVLEVMRSGSFAQGPRVQAFEEGFASYSGANFGVATSSGTSALFLALLAHGIGPGDEVITTPLTFIASANAIAQTGARPVFGDVDSSLNLDPEMVEELITPRTKAIMPVHLHGNPCDMPRFASLAKDHGLALVQDACQAVGATVCDMPLGRFGTAVYSLYATKNITTGEGGMITTSDAMVAEKAASLRHQAYSSEPYLHNAIGYNFRMTEMQAAIGLAQLRKLPEINRRRRDTAAFYDHAISHPDFSRPTIRPGAVHVYYQYTLRVRSNEIRPRDEVRAALAEAGIGTGVYYPVPLHLQPAYLGLECPPRPEAERAVTEIVSIPVHPGVSDRDRERIAEVVNAL